jgi:hypothetical protein
MPRTITFWKWAAVFAGEREWEWKQARSREKEKAMQGRSVGMSVGFDVQALGGNTLSNCGCCRTRGVNIAR